MTTPDVPLEQLHTELIADLSRVLPMRDGLARILGDPAAETLVDAAVASEPGDGVHGNLMADIEANVRLHAGLQEILDAESGHVDLVSDLAAVVDIARGLAGIIHPPPTPAPRATPAPPTSGVPASFHKVIGIDLGTTNSTVSIWDGGEIRIIESAWGTGSVPSVVSLDPQGEVIVGAPAQNNLVVDPANTVVEVKRLLGAYEVEPSGPGDLGVPRRIRFRGREYLPQEITAFILMELKRQAESLVGEEIHDAVITVPAYFGVPQREATEEAARMAGLAVRMLLNEPIAAAVSFGADKVDDGNTRTYAVYDLGGTFDVSIIQERAGTVNVVATGGDSQLGGGDLDDRITDYVLQHINDEHGVDLSQDRAIRQRVKREAEIRKRELSEAAATVLNLPFLTPTLSVNVPLARVTFEALIQDLLQRSLDRVSQAVRSAGIEPDEIEQVLLVGGATRIPGIRPMLAEHMGLDLTDIRGDINPDEAVARGAAMIARGFPPSDREGRLHAAEAVAHAPMLQDVTRHTLGLMVYRNGDAEIAAMLPKDSRIPAENTREFANGSEGTEIDLLIFEGDSPDPLENTLIGRLSIVLPEARKRGHYRFEVTFSLDLDGLLRVVVKCLNDGRLWQVDLRTDVSPAHHSVRAGVAVASVLPSPPVPDAAAIVRPPPAEVPDEFKSIARRAFKLIGTLDGADRERLVAAYEALVNAVEHGSARVEELGDALGDVYLEVRPR